MGPAMTERIHAELPGIAVEELPGGHPVDPGIEGDVLLAFHRSHALEGLRSPVPWVHLYGTGVDGLPQEVFEGRVVTCSRGAGAGPISEFVLACMLAFEKRLPQSWVSEPPEHWSIAELGGLSGRNVSIIGLGGIGSAIARLALAFGTNVRAMRRTGAPSPVAGVKIEHDIRDLVAGAHHVVVAAPSTSRTYHLVDRSVFDAMSDGAHLVNIARGALVDQDALRAALDSGRVGMASLDTCDPEPLPEGHWLYSHPKVRLSPHISWSSPEMDGRIFSLFVENVRARMEGKPMSGVVDPAEGY